MLELIEVYLILDVQIKVFPLTALSFIKVNEKSLTIYPNQWKQLGVHDLVVVLTDTNLNSVDYKFKLTVTNSAPYFKDKLKNVKMLLND